MAVMKTPILLVEDEPSIADNVLYALESEGFAPHWTETGREALEQCRQRPFALVILDIGLPDTSGWELFKALQDIRALPTIFLTARAEEIDRVLGLELGADDYVTKPFSPRELVARVKAVLRRGGGADASSGPCEFVVRAERHEIVFRGEALSLSRTEYRLLQVFLEHPGRVFSRGQLMDLAWEEPDAAMDRTVDAHVKMLRAKLQEAGAPSDAIVTHRGVGYSWRESGRS